jgi:uncharacterized protein involved in copper resistance
MAPLEETAGPAAKPLKLGIGAFFIGLCGVVFGLVIDYGPNEPLSFVAFGIVALAVYRFHRHTLGFAIDLSPSSSGQR